MMKYLLLFILCFSARAEKKPNILFILTDQHFADAMSHVIGDEHIKTPNLDRLAKSGVRFTKAYACNPLCIPARNSIFTGYYPFETGIQNNSNKQAPKDYMTLMGVHFKKAGYDTGYFGKWHINIKKNDSKKHGFDAMGVLKANGADHLIPKPAIDFMKKKREKPFLLVTSFTSAHDICELCRGDKIPSGDLGPLPAPELCPPAPFLGHTHDETDTISTMRKSYTNARLFPVANFTSDKWRQMRWGYYRLIERTDKHIGKVLKALEESKLNENTLIIFTADHGDCTGAHGFAQKTVFYDESSRIPLFVSFKGKISPATSDALVNVGVDTLPTMMDFAGIPKPEKLQGRSLKTITENPATSNWREYIVVSNHMIQGSTEDKPIGRMLRTARFKYSIYDLGKHRESLIDMKEDPLEMKNLARNPEYKTVLEKHRGLLKEYAEKSGDNEAKELLPEN
ncbi:MAG: sulfatase-like hydrolase/transferase [Lentisphaeraceae bacterium]|nr:sulfatase-like hydrolase/transferase [Lentisphaeraceae bacterium]